MHYLQTSRSVIALPEPKTYRNVRVFAVHFSPEACAALLTMNTRNRRPNPKTQRQFRAALAEGSVFFSDSAVVISDTNVILNGQNRLMAAVDSGIGFDGILVTGASIEAQLVMDTGGKRTFAQHLHIAYGEANAQEKAAVTAALWKYENGNYGYRGDYNNRPDPRMTDLDRLWSEVGSEIVDALSLTYSIRKRTLYTQSSLALVRILTARIDQEDSDYFFEKLESGSELPEGSPILAARRWMETQNRRGSMGRPNTERQVAILVKAWNKYRAGEPVGALIFRPGGANPESYPEPK